MIIKNVTLQELLEAKRKVNMEFAGNINMIAESKGVNRYKVNLRTYSRKHAGVALSQGYFRLKNGERRKTSSACWHAHGVFFDSLPLKAIIETQYGRVRPGDPWFDHAVVQGIELVNMSELCYCDHWRVYLDHHAYA